MKKNFFVYMTSFFCGMSVMAVELSATRMLATTFSSSSIIYTIVIGLIMISLSIGNVIGGRSADKQKNADKLYFMIGIASVWIAIIPVIGKYVTVLSAAIFVFILPENLIVAGSITSCLIIFSFPLVIMGMVSPYLVKLGLKDISNSGKTAGEIYALSTIGSIIGTFVPTFVTIPTLGTSKTFFVFAIILNLISLYYFVTNKRKIIRSVITTLIIITLALAPLNSSYAFWEKNIVYEGESMYNYLKVTEYKDSVILSTNVAFGVQSIYKKNNTLSGYYYDYGLMAPFFIRDTSFDKKLNVLILGLGTGTYAKQCKRYFPNSSTDGVEIDQKIVDLSKQYFELKENEAKIYVNDGRTFLMSKEAKRYDLIMVDAYHDITIPFHMSTVEFFRQVKEHLRDNGVILININMRSEKNNEITDYLTQTVKHVMNKVYKYDLQTGTNTLVFASDDKNCIENYKNNISILSESDPLFKISNSVKSNLVEISEANHIFTDDIAPVELMGQKMLDDVVGSELEYFKQQLKSSGNGIKGIFDMISNS
ncbi:MAG: fused MFS/spermidine synthase [Clostridia bacterium]|nr:fused MFS/spermidine synthase [Clostridia bacterium]